MEGDGEERQVLEIVDGVDYAYLHSTGNCFRCGEYFNQLRGPGPFMSVDVHECVSLVRKAT